MPAVTQAERQVLTSISYFAWAFYTMPAVNQAEQQVSTSKPRPLPPWALAATSREHSPVLAAVLQ